MSGFVGFLEMFLALTFFEVEVDCKSKTGGFFFGLATAPAHVEDNLNDSWLEFAQKSVMVISFAIFDF